jgi:hypothetical protein
MIIAVFIMGRFFFEAIPHTHKKTFLLGTSQTFSSYVLFFCMFTLQATHSCAEQQTPPAWPAKDRLWAQTARKSVLWKI